MLKFKKFEITLKILEPSSLPKLKGITLRGGFGNIFKSIACIQKNVNCIECILNESCIYRKIFDSPRPENSLKMTKYPYIPHPFVIYSDNFDTSFEIGSLLNFGLVLFGENIANLPFFVYSFIKLGEIGIGKYRVKFDVVSVKDDEREIFEFNKKTIYNFSEKPCVFDITKFSNINGMNKAIKIDLLSPLSMRFNGKTVLTPEFHILVRNLLRRASLLEFFYGEPSFDSAFIQEKIDEASNVKIVENSSHLENLKRFSGRQKKIINHMGLVGSITYQNVSENLFSLLESAQSLSLGRNTSFGFGRYLVNKL